MNLKFLINYIRNMKCYFYFLILQLVLIITLIAYVFAGMDENRHSETIVFSLECFLTFIIICEVLVRMAMNRKAFFKNIWNIIDVFGVSLIVALFLILFFFESADETAREEDDIIPAILLAARYAAQTVRIIMTLKQNHAFRNVANIDIVFDNEKEMSVEGPNKTEEASL